MAVEPFECQCGSRQIRALLEDGRDEGLDSLPWGTGYGWLGLLGIGRRCGRNHQVTRHVTAERAGRQGIELDLQVVIDSRTG